MIHRLRIAIVLLFGLACPVQAQVFVVNATGSLYQVFAATSNFDDSVVVGAAFHLSLSFDISQAVPASSNSEGTGAVQQFSVFGETGELDVGDYHFTVPVETVFVVTRNPSFDFLLTFPPDSSNLETAQSQLQLNSPALSSALTMTPADMRQATMLTLSNVNAVGVFTEIAADGSQGVAYATIDSFSIQAIPEPSLPVLSTIGGLVLVGAVWLRRHERQVLQIGEKS